MLIIELHFADDVAIAAHSEIELQRRFDRLPEECDLFGLRISIKKTDVIPQGTNSPSEIKKIGHFFNY